MRPVARKPPGPVRPSLGQSWVTRLLLGVVLRIGRGNGVRVDRVDRCVCDPANVNDNDHGRFVPWWRSHLRRNPAILPEPGFLGLLCFLAT